VAARDLNQTQVKGRQALLAGTQPTRLAETDVERDIAGMEKLAPNWTDPENRERLKEMPKALTFIA
jgi:hypothetical protein